MKKLALITTVVFILTVSPLIAEGNEEAEEMYEKVGAVKGKPTDSDLERSSEVIDKKPEVASWGNPGSLSVRTTELPPVNLYSENSNKLFVTFNYGASAAWLTRIIKQSGRSNFVLRDFLPGVYFNTELQNIPYFLPSARITAYYPLTSSFNQVPQKQKTPLHFGFDFFTGGRFKYDWKFLRLSVGPGLHMFFMTADRWNYFNLGVAATAGVELAITPGWVLVIDGFASYDSGNLGSNRQMEPFDVTYQYQAAVGVRYSKKKRSDSALFMPKEEKLLIVFRHPKTNEVD